MKQKLLLGHGTHDPGDDFIVQHVHTAQYIV